MKRKRILYAEDDPANRQLLKIRLERAGLECHAVEDGSLALQMFAENDYDLVVLDQYMPFFDGEAVAAEIRRSSNQTPIIAVTSDDTLEKQLIEAGFDAVLVKPLRGNEAVDLIKLYL